MSANDIVVVGAGGHAREIIEAIGAGESWRLLGVVSDGNEHPDRLAALGTRHLGPVTALADIEASYIIGIGDPGVRRKVSHQAELAGRRAATVIHPAAVIADSATIYEGCYIAAGAILTACVTVGAHTHINVGATISHDCEIGTFSNIGPGSHVAGWARIGQGAELGIGSNILPRLRIGEHTVIGAGSTVTRDIPADVTAVGTPARLLPHSTRRSRDEPEPCD